MWGSRRFTHLGEYCGTIADGKATEFNFGPTRVLDLVRYERITQHAFACCVVRRLAMARPDSSICYRFGRRLRRAITSAAPRLNSVRVSPLDVIELMLGNPTNRLKDSSRTTGMSTSVLTLGRAGNP